MKDFAKKNHVAVEWSLGALVVVSSLLVWFMAREPGDNALTIYDVFPLFGLLAFGLMWTHFVMGAIRRYANVKPPKNNIYGTASFGIVLGLLILHPGLLWLGLYNDGYGLPPASHVKAYEDQILFVGLGTLGLTIFLAYELRRWFGKKKWWKFVEYAQIVGMAAIFVHAIDLGNELQVNWYMALWWFFGISLAASIAYSEIIKRKEERNG